MLEVAWMLVGMEFKKQKPSVARKLLSFSKIMWDRL